MTLSKNKQADTAQHRHARPIAITMGDPGSISPEIVLESLDQSLQASPDSSFCVFAHVATMRTVAELMRLSHVLSSERVTLTEPHGVESIGSLPLDEIRTPNKRSGYISMRCVEAAIDACLAGWSSEKTSTPRAIVTAPISKTAWHLAGFDSHPGHTELLAERCRARDVRMAFVSPKLRVVLETIHVPLREVSDMLDGAHIERTIEMAAQMCKDLGVASPRLAVAGVNPHAGEQGMMGTEDDAIIAPAVARARHTGIDVAGPLPGDTVFVRAVQNDYDCVVAMYHDQGLIPVKLLGWDSAVNVTLGLPIVRTSPDHGTAFDIAGTHTAHAGSMAAAIELAIRLSENR